MKRIVISKWGEIHCGPRGPSTPLGLICCIAMFTPLTALAVAMVFTSGNDSRSWLFLAIFLGAWSFLILQLVIAWPRPCVIIDDAGITDCGQGSEPGHLLIPWECIIGVDLNNLGNWDNFDGLTTTRVDAWVMYVRLDNKQPLEKLSPTMVGKDTSIWTIDLSRTYCSINRIYKWLQQKQIPYR